MRTRFAAGFTAIVAAALCAGCAEEAPDRAWVLLDAEARQSGVGVVVDGEEYPAGLPIEVDADTELTIVDGDAVATPLWTEPGAIHHVMGREAEVWTGFVGVDVVDDAIEVFGDEDAAWRLADEVGGVIEDEGETRMLVYEGLYDALAVADVVDEDLDLWPIEQDPPPMALTGERLREQAVGAVGELGSRILGQVGAAAPKAPMEITGSRFVPFDHNPVELDRQVMDPGDPFLQALQAERSAADMVGWYCRGDECVVLGIDFTAQECLGEVCTDATWHMAEGGVQVGPRFYAADVGGLNAGGVKLVDMLEVTL